MSWTLVNNTSYFTLTESGGEVHDIYPTDIRQLYLRGAHVWIVYSLREQENNDPTVAYGVNTLKLLYSDFTSPTYASAALLKAGLLAVIATMSTATLLLELIDRVEELINSKYISESLVDTTNVSATTHYYPSSTGSSMDDYSDLSLSGKLIDADGTLTLTVEMMNDEDTTSGDWVQIYGYDDKNDISANSWAVTNNTLTFAISFNNANYKYYRVAVVASGATNTVIVKERKKAI